jgi:hypothetical protein
MDGNIDPLDSYVKELLGNIKFLDNLFTRTRVLWGIAGIIGLGGLLVAIALIIK